MITILIMLSNFSISYTGTITATTVRLREEPDSSSSTLQLIGLGKTVEILDEEDDWYKVTYDGVTGYIAKDYISVEDDDSSSNTINDVTNDSDDSLADATNNANSSQNTESEIDDESLDEDTVEDEEIAENLEVDEEETSTTFTLSKDVDIRSIPSFSSNIVNTIENGSEVTVLITLNKWVKITDGNVTGWVIRQNT